CAKHSQVDEAELGQVSEDGGAGAGPTGPLPAPRKVPLQALPREEVDLPGGSPTVAQPIVVGPPFEVAVEPPDQLGQRRVALLPVDHPAQFLALARQRLLGGMQVPVAPGTPFEIAVETEAEAEEVEGLPRFTQVHHPCL